MLANSIGSVVSEHLASIVSKQTASAHIQTERILFYLIFYEK